MMLKYARTLFPHINISHDLSLEPGTILISHKCAQALPYVNVNGLRYGCVFNKRTAKDRFAFILHGSSRLPCRIQWIFELKVPGQPAHQCAVIQRFFTDNEIPQFPWNM
jgi:hypothetical protein